MFTTLLHNGAKLRKDKQEHTIGNGRRLDRPLSEIDIWFMDFEMMKDYVCFYRICTRNIKS